MHWIVNADLHGEPAYARLVEELIAQGRRHTIVRKAPMADYLLSVEDDLDEDGHNRPLEIEPDGPMFATGTTALAGISRRSGWSPGFIEAPSQTECIAAWGEQMLNHDAVIAPLSAMQPVMENFFIRPVEDLKSFPGTVLSLDEYESWRRAMTSSKGVNKVPMDTPVMVAALRRIDAEYRCVCVNGRVVAKSRYRLKGRLSLSPVVEQDVLAYLDERLAEWNPRPAVTIDVARTPEGLRIIETNSVSSSGFYAIDMAAFVKAISDM